MCESEPNLWGHQMGTFTRVYVSVCCSARTHTRRNSRQQIPQLNAWPVPFPRDTGPPDQVHWEDLFMQLWEKYTYPPPPHRTIFLRYSPTTVENALVPQY